MPLVRARTLIPGTALLFVLFLRLTFAQVSTFPYTEAFDSVPPATLPTGWTSSRVRAVGRDDFSITRTLPHSAPQALLATNATVAQFLISPVFDFSANVPHSLMFCLRRSTSFRACILVETVEDAAETYPTSPSDTLKPAEASGYTCDTIALSPLLADRKSVRFRWRVLPDTVGSSGTLRIDDIAVDVEAFYDIAVSRLRCEPSVPAAGESLRVIFTVRNRGLRTAHAYGVIVYDDRNGDDVPQPEERTGSCSDLPSLEPGDSGDVACPVGPFKPGYHSLVGMCTFGSDQVPLNNRQNIRICVTPPRGAVGINEIMYAPFPGEAEYVELVNTGRDTIELAGWTLHDRAGEIPPNNRTLLRSPARFGLPPGFFFVVSSDSSIFSQFPSLNGLGQTGMSVMEKGAMSLRNAGDLVLLRDPSGSVIDSCVYSPSWHNPSVFDETGRSLEKITPFLESSLGRSWSTCADPSGGTPGKENSIRNTTGPSPSRLSCSPNPFSPDGDGRDDFVLVQYRLPVAPTTISIRIYDVVGRLVRRLVNNEPGGRQGEAAWDGRDDDRNRARIGMYIVVLESIDDAGGGISREKALVVLAGKL